MIVGEITRGAIDPRALEASVGSDACGGIATFLGVVRERSHDDRAVTGLSYEAHEQMALAEFAAIAREIEEHHPEVRLGIVHRIGDLRIGEIAVAVCAAAPHRAQAFVPLRDRRGQIACPDLEEGALWRRQRRVDRQRVLAGWPSN